MDTFGKPVPWIKGKVITPIGNEQSNRSCLLRYGGLRILKSSDESPDWYYIQTDRSLTGEYVATFVHCPYEITRLRGGGSRFPNGTWRGGLAALHDGQMDIILLLHGMLPERMEVCQFGPVVTVGQMITILGMELREGLKAYSILRLATPKIWTLIFISIFLVSLVLAINPRNVDTWAVRAIARLGRSL